MHWHWQVYAMQKDNICVIQRCAETHPEHSGRARSMNEFIQIKCDILQIMIRVIE